MSYAITPTDQDWQEIEHFKMPPVEFGDMVVVYNQGDTTGSPKEAMIVKVEGRSIVLRKLSADEWMRPTESLRHKDDPELRFKPGLRNKGTWDLHPKVRAERERLDWLEARIKKLEQLSSIVNADKAVLESATPDEKIEPVAKTKEQWAETAEAYEGDILELTGQGKTATEIADFLGAGWTKQRVGVILAKAKKKLEPVS